MNLRNQPSRVLRPPSRLGVWSYFASSIVLASCLVALYFGLQPTVERWLVERWENQLTELPASLAPGVMADAATQGDWGLRLLTTATLSPNEPAQQAACRELELQLERWAAEATADHSADVVRLTAFLANHLERYNETQQRELRPLVQRLTNWPIDRRHADSAAFIAHCETLARRVAEIRLAAVTTPSPAKTVPVDPPRSPVENNPLPDNRESEPNDVREPVSDEPTPQERADPELILEMLPASPNEIRRLPSRSPRRIDSRPATKPTSDFREDAPADEVIPIANERLEALTDWEVITRFYAAEINPQWVEAELARRGYQPRDIAIARRAAHPEVVVRMQLIEELPQLKGIDARLWLRQLGLDPAAEVRKRAHALLRTSGDLSTLQTKM